MLNSVIDFILVYIFENDPLVSLDMYPIMTSSRNRGVVNQLFCVIWPQPTGGLQPKILIQPKQNQGRNVNIYVIHKKSR